MSSCWRFTDSLTSLWHTALMKILLIEDNQKTIEWVRQGLTEAGYVVDYACDGRDGLHLALQEHYSLIILDIMLPGLDGWQVYARYALRISPLYCLTARDSVEDRVKGLEAGANDYLLSLFLRRTAGAGESSTQTACPGLTRLTINGLDMDATKQSVSRNGKPISLTRKEFLLLWLLASRAGEIVPRTAIASEVWGINFDSETNTVDVAIRRLRAKVDDPFEKKLIMTVRGMGYRLQAEASQNG